jgi:two-component system response regulator HydG
VNLLATNDSPELWKTVLDVMDEGVMLVKDGGAITYVNRAMEQLTGYSREEMVGKTCAFLDFDCCPRPPGGVRQGPCPLFRDGQLCDKRCSLKRRDGSRVALRKNAQVVTDAKGQILCAVEVQSDITLLEQKQREIRELRDLLTKRSGFHGIIGACPQMEALFDLVRKAADSDSPVLIYGETGTGKEIVASAIHELGRKSGGPFIRVNCAALHESLLESELFGHVKGSFTGADRTTKGRFEAAQTGEIFLDEIGDVPLSMQVKLLRIVEEKVLERVGDYKPIALDVRVISATHRDLRVMVANGSFREDLFYRLNVIPISVPPLRERSADIPLLIEHFIRTIAARTGKHVTGLDHEAMDFMLRYSWPGNVRELINFIEYAFVVCPDHIIRLSDLPILTSCLNGLAKLRPQVCVEEDQKEKLIEALIMARGKKTAAARMLGVSRQTVWSWIRKYSINRDLLTSRFRE